jgi:protein transport protein SEC61 subunit alpha
MGFNLLYALEPLARLFPRVARPKAIVTLGEKTACTAVVLFAYLICCQIPLFGIIRNQSSDPLYWTRVILASSRGTLM